ncbi:hypothetical protein [Thiocapsa rosea]|uniref:Outer membrane protein with beta-barrel domain n=1 Tax=Thiocapsa rosea TaxID=69360 RepID=A0A495VAG3_9GAMM|nr:hypothetical protein [Thiocapsa rosea]RKT45445.1 hypothetical protein BDD21_2899 [Thiocapsa rosea]
MIQTTPALSALAQATALCVGSLIAIPAVAEVDSFDGNWRFSVTPYLWLPNVNGNLDYASRGLSTEIGPNDYLSNLQFALMLSGEARKGPWSVVTDIIYLDLGNQDSRIRPVSGARGEPLPISLNQQAETSLSATVWTLAGGYTLSHGDWGNVDLLAGFRYLGLDTELTWQLAGSDGRLDRTGKVSSNREQWDGILGVKGQVLFGDTRWFMPYYLDVGTGSSNWTWQAALGAGYRFDWGDITLALRSLSYEFDEDNTDIRFTGPVLGATFRW